MISAATDEKDVQKEAVPSPDDNPDSWAKSDGGQDGTSGSSYRERAGEEEEEEEEEEGEETYPEGGREAWLVVLGSWFALFPSLGIMNVLATLQAYVSRHQLASYDSSTTGWIFSTYTFLAFVLGVYIGPIFDKHGPRGLIMAGTLCFSVSIMLLSISTHYWHFMLVFGLLLGLATALLFTPSIAAVGHFFRLRRGFATGMASTAGSLGGVTFPLMLQSLFTRVGWAWSLRILGFLCFALLVAANFLIDRRLPPRQNASVHPDPHIFRDRAFALTTLAVFLVEFALFLPLTYISSYALAQGFSEAFSFRIMTLMNTGSFFGRLLPGYWADSIGAFNSNMISIAISIVACLAIWLPAGHTTAGLVVFSLLFGFSSGGNITLVPVAIGRLCKTQEYGRYYATCYTIVSFACLIGIPVGGKVLETCTGEYWGLILMTGLIYVASLLAFMAAKIAAVGWDIRAIF
ncbi:hypothetical protein DL546_006657 [Coniochaeta pulveracea]|uniref:Major facilitator superfamily (MFS) profile domain-containing protein n=1 Tax=Coniochaeta pulveracea TaxID=177199 RepID=A0A420YG18_9PEZI|nr:hypothetical protein DL546_006657 [Coniochaeta pulveracea]